MRPPGRVPLGGGRVLAVVAGQVEVFQVRAGVAAVQLQVAEGDPEGGGGRAQVGLVEGVVLRVEVRRRGQCRQPGGDPGPGQVLNLAVVLVPAGVLADLGHGQVADGAQPRGQVIHDRTVPVSAREAGAGPRCPAPASCWASSG